MHGFASWFDDSDEPELPSESSRGPAELDALEALFDVPAIDPPPVPCVSAGE